MQQFLGKPVFGRGNSLLREYLGCGRLQDALILYFQTRMDVACSLDVHTYVSLLNACSKLKDSERGKEIHKDVARTGLLDRDIYIGSALLNMYAKCGLLTEAQALFDKLPAQDIATWNALITGYSKCGQGTQALYYFERMKSKGFSPNVVTFMCALKACGSIGDANKGTELHMEIERKRLLEGDLFLGSTLVDMYTKCGLLVRAQEVFDKLPIRNIVSWTALIAGYTENGHGKEGLVAFEKMRSEGVFPNSVTYVCSLNACGSIKALDKGELLHLEIERKGLLKENLPVGNALIDMYISCGSLNKAQEVFDKLPSHDVASWNALMTGYLEHNYGQRASAFLIQMQLQGVLPNIVTFVTCLRACGAIGAIEKVQELQAQITTEQLLDGDMIVGTILIDIYVKCSLFQEAQELFNKFPTRNISMWNALTSGYANHGLVDATLQCLEEMKLEMVAPDIVSFICALRACTNTGNPESGFAIHMEIEKRGFLQNDIAGGNAVVYMYAKSGLLAEAQHVFDHFLLRDVISWNGLMEGYTEHEEAEGALQCVDQMQSEGLSPSFVTYLYIIKACCQLGDMVKSIEVHGQIARMGLLDSYPIIGSALVNMYAQFGSPGKAQEVFDRLVLQNIISWKALIAGYVDNELNEEALGCIELMQVEGISLDAGAYLYGLKASCGTGALEKVKELHDQIIKKGYEKVDTAVNNALIDMYTTFGLLDDAQSIFIGLPMRNVVSWNSMIAGYLRYGLAEVASKSLEHMQFEGVCFNNVTFACSLNICGCIKATEKGQNIHIEITIKGFLEEDLVVGTALVDMYTKFGMLPEARMVFDSLSSQDAGMWNALMVGYLGQMDEKKVLECFEQMQLQGCSPDTDTFVCSLKACAAMHAIARGRELHSVTIRTHFLEKDSLVGNTLIDMYTKCGSLSEAHKLFDKLHVQDVVAWTTLITGYVEHGYSEAAVGLYRAMHSCGVLPNEVTLLGGLRACQSIGAIDIGLEIHREIELRGLLDSNLAIGTSLVAMYIKCGFLSIAQRVFDRIPVHNVVLWNALMAGYVQVGHSEEIFLAFDKMLGTGIKPDTATFAIVLSACSQAGLLDTADVYFKAMSTSYGIKPALEHHTCMVDLLGRTGALNKAAVRICQLTFVDDVAWRTIMDSCQKWGNVDLGRHAFQHIATLSE
ncbi:hypothetical protein GOP47_0011971 [Adiantum capillus-veneris]|uniref:Pentatricopeptide repeat-containing protein n=1 Tax=Adiantum capillus-veneris TaxID=13818 RepID=A0A9D4ZFV7_ADICA|nr:hypothetical protein GOP47_0011971 [Adiantum capillus-veneris]